MVSHFCLIHPMCAPGRVSLLRSLEEQSQRTVITRENIPAHGLLLDATHMEETWFNPIDWLTEWLNATLALRPKCISRSGKSNDEIYIFGLTVVKYMYIYYYYYQDFIRTQSTTALQST